MGVGEYLIIFAAILIGLAVADLALSIHRLLRAGRSIQWHPIVPIMALIALCLILNLWWGMFRGYSEVETMSFIKFLPQVLMMLSLFLLTAAVLPDEKLPEGASLKEYYLDSRRLVWGLMATYLLIVSGMNLARGLDEGWTVGQQLQAAAGNVIMLVLSLLLTQTKRMWFHWLVVILFLITIVISWATATIGTPATA